eukprot:147127-Amphidinium_carterae.1
MAAALRDAGYRSGHLYVSELRQMHVQDGFEWTPTLALTCKQCLRALGRGLGPLWTLGNWLPALLRRKMFKQKGGNFKDKPKLIP